MSKNFILHYLFNKIATDFNNISSRYLINIGYKYLLILLII